MGLFGVGDGVEGGIGVGVDVGRGGGGWLGVNGVSDPCLVVAMAVSRKNELHLRNETIKRTLHGMGYIEVVRNGTGWEGVGCDGIGWDGMGWDGAGRDGVEWGGMGRHGMGWGGPEGDGMGLGRIRRNSCMTQDGMG